jgi:hypothetical protein
VMSPLTQIDRPNCAVFESLLSPSFGLEAADVSTG